MSLKYKLTSAFALAVAVAGFSVAASAQDATVQPKEKIERSHVKGEHRGMRRGGEFGRKHGMHGGMLRGLRELNLTEAQKTQLKAIHEANRPDRTKMEGIRALMMAKRDGTITAEQQAELKAFREASRLRAEKVRGEILAILTPEQRQQLEAKQLEMKQRREERRLQYKMNKAGDKPTDN